MTKENAFKRKRLEATSIIRKSSNFGNIGGDGCDALFRTLSINRKVSLISMSCMSCVRLDISGISNEKFDISYFKKSVFV